MLKKMFDALKGRKAASRSDPPASVPTQKAHAELITVFDTYGRELKITRNEWREKVLGPNLHNAWNDAEKLYSLIVSALNDGFTDEVNEASSRLLEIDSNIERSHTIRGIVLMKRNELDESERVLRAAIGRVGETGTLLTNLAKVFASRGLQKEADETLERAIHIDPNMENGLGWWLSIQKERDGDEGYAAALARASRIPGSWLPQLWMARRYLETGKAEVAIALYQSVLDSGLFKNDALMMISGDLGNNQQVAAIIELVAPVFDPARHDPRAGINLLQAYLQLKRRREGEALLGRMYALDMAPFKQHLDRFSAEFQKMAVEEMPPRPIDSSELQVETVALDRPVWSYNLSEPTWLIAEKGVELAKVALISFAKVSGPTERSEEQREDDIGRMTRAIPLYLAEAIHYWTDLRASTLVPCVKNGGPVVFGSGGDDRALCVQFAADFTYLVTGDIEASAEQWRVSCRLWDCAAKEQLLETSVQSDLPGLGHAALQLEAQLLAVIGHRRDQPHDAFYQRPPADAMSPYLSGLGQHFMMSLLANGLAPKSGLWGERAMLEWPLTMALHWKQLETAKLMYFSGLAKAAAYGSDVLHEFKDRTIQLVKDLNREQAPAAGLAPLMSNVLGIELPLDGQSSDPSYMAWLERVRFGGVEHSKAAH